MNVSERTKLVFATNLDYLMKATDTGIPISQRELAKHLGVSQGAVSTWLQEQKFPRADTLRAIANFFHVKVSALTNEDFIENHMKSTMKQEVIELLDALNIVENCLKFPNDDPLFTSDEFFDFVATLSSGTDEERQNHYKQAVFAGGGDEAITKLVSIAMNLNDAGKQKAIEYASDLESHDKYSAIIISGLLDNYDE